ncbi:hypothetical protein QC764_609160 [Podospora pseudoanserina]|uniref:Cytochrome P450 E-class, group I n=1 Tax=Podospora pseudoanserina TaxID=2609844 RepID=A0ABR0HUN5_9PEZI|nr:hypothetical protein QC764_609160 [Podospora pseudoanserina]
MPHHFIFGHMIESGKAFKDVPMEINRLTLTSLFLRQHSDIIKDGVIVMDVWPMIDPILYVMDPEIVSQFSNQQVLAKTLPKSNQLKDMFKPMFQGKDLLTMDGPEWKRWRAIYNPGFSAKNVATMAPEFIEEIDIFKRHLRKVAMSGEVVKMQQLAINLTIDVIGRAVLGNNFKCQAEGNPLEKAIADQVKWLIPNRTPDALVKLLNPFRLYDLWRLERIIRNVLAPAVRENLSNETSTTLHKTILSLAVKAYLAENPDSNPKVDLEAFLNRTIPHLKIFIFAGHDTTATSLCFAYYLLSQNPQCLAKLRSEHDAILGPDPSQAAAKIAANPQLLNSLVYTTAVIKETLRIFPPALTVRQGRPDVTLHNHKTGKTYPTDGFLVIGATFATHKLEEYFPRNEEFLPERFLAKEGEELYVGKNAFRPFELGPRACIGQELAMMELRMILGLTVREFDFEVDESVFMEGGKRLWGQRVYMVGGLAGHPKGGMPMRVKVRRR